MKVLVVRRIFTVRMKKIQLRVCSVFLTLTPPDG